MRQERQLDTIKLIVVFRKFTDPPKNAAVSNMCRRHFNSHVLPPVDYQPVEGKYSFIFMEDN
jgi:hypothetical protein